jgi:hypothetical protein
MVFHAGALSWPPKAAKLRGFCTAAIIEASSSVAPPAKALWNLSRFIQRKPLSSGSMAAEPGEGGPCLLRDSRLSPSSRPKAVM